MGCECAAGAGYGGGAGGTGMVQYGEREEGEERFVSGGTSRWHGGCVGSVVGAYGLGEGVCN